ncbi:RNA 2',3'-cyclic phosphodiesterase [Streptomyces sp. NPDC088261]|uniref:RNA 2',3'-cyclic phosphodiesterase n=1 Tax=Streptomyces sp. NPDC088261 TaxID=3365851 RepID=UPI003812F074
MRLFAAVLPPDRVVAELAGVVRPLRELEGGGGGALRWTGEAGWHFTLAFMGEVDDAVVPELTGRLARAAYRTQPFSLRVHGSGHFGGRALWAGAAGGLDALRLLAERTDAAARRAGVPMEEHRRYQPHLTLARTDRERGDDGAGDRLRPYVEALAGFEGTPWDVSELALVRSRLPGTAEGAGTGSVGWGPGQVPRYETVARCPLGAGPGGPPGEGAAPVRRNLDG